MVVGGALFFYNGINYFLATLTSLPQEIRTTLVAGMSAVILLCITKYYEKRSDVEKSIREKKTPIYEGMMDFFLDMMMAEKLGKSQKTEEEMMQWFYSNSKSIVVWASDDVVKKFADIRNLGSEEKDLEKSGKKILFLIEDLMMSIRKDLGHKNSNFSKGTLLSLFVNDIKNFM